MPVSQVRQTFALVAGAIVLLIGIPLIVAGLQTEEAPAQELVVSVDTSQAPVSTVPLTTTTAPPTTVAPTTTTPPTTAPPPPTTAVKRAPTTTAPRQTEPAVSGDAERERFLACVKDRESGGDYTANNSSSTAAGAYQFLDSTARLVAGWMGRSDLGSDASQWSPADQETGARVLYAHMGKSPWASKVKPC